MILFGELIQCSNEWFSNEECTNECYNFLFKHDYEYMNTVHSHVYNASNNLLIIILL
jgi:hypothetical protein